MNICTKTIEIEWKPATLLWDGDSLVDITTGQRATCDGNLEPARYFVGYPFDGAVGLRHRDYFWAVAFEKLGTKAVLFKDGKIQRELNRSCYCAKEYEYPVALGVAADSGVVLLHCPSKFNVLEVEEAETGKHLASAATRNMEFHSRLALSPDHRFVIDAGWFWHPWCGLWVFDLVDALGNPNAFGEAATFKDGTNVCFEVDSACFLDSGRLVVSSTPENLGKDEEPPESLRPQQLGVWSIHEHRWLSKFDLNEPTGPLMAVGENVLTLYGHPKLMDVNSGEVLYRWEDFDTGKLVGALRCGEASSLSIVADGQNRRFAVATPNGVTIVSLV